MEYDKSKVYTAVNAEELKVGDNGWLVSMEALLENYEFLDGTPCGVEE